MDINEAIQRHNAMRDELVEAMEAHIADSEVLQETDPDEIIRLCAEAAARYIEPRPTERWTVGRWKYAEEHAHDLIRQGKIIRITMIPDVKHVDEDDVREGIDPPEVYVYDEFHVDVMGER